MENAKNIKAEEIKAEEVKAEETAVAIREASTFKVPYVREAVQKIYTMRAGLEKRIEDFKSAEEQARRETAKLLYTVDRDKLYKTEGFNSLPAFAETIGVKASEARKLAASGRLMANTNEKVKEYSEKASLSNMRELASVNPVEVTKAIENGDITPDSTVEQIKAWKAKVNPAKPKVVDRMDYVGMIYGNTIEEEEFYKPDGWDGIKEKVVSYSEEICYYNAIPDEIPCLLDFNWSFTKVGEERVHIGFNPNALSDSYTGPVMAWYIAHKPIKTATTNTKALSDKDAEIADLKAKLEALMAQLAK